MTPLARRGAAGVLALILCLSLGGPLRAQTVTVPAPVQPVLALVSPTVSPVCGDATLVTVLLPALVALPIAVPPQVEQALAPLAIVCGAIPAPKGGFTCGLDAQAQALVDSITYQAAGTASPVAITPGAIATEQVATIEDSLPPELKEFDLGKTVAGTFQCVPTAPQGAPHPKPATPVPSTQGALPSASPVGANSTSSPAETAPLAPLPASGSVTAQPANGSVPETTTVLTAPAKSLAVQPTLFKRAGLPLGPLLLLIALVIALGAGLAAAVTRPIIIRSMRERP